MVKLQNPAEDIVPTTAFRTHLASILKRLEQQRGPIILTHNGKAKAVLLDLEVYQELMENLEVAKATIPSMMAVIKGEVEGIEGIKIKKGAKK